MTRIAIIGASGGIGKAFVEHYAGREETALIHAFSRSGHVFTHNNVQSFSIDIADPVSIEHAAASVADYSLDLVIVATGILHADDGLPLQPERALHELDAEKMQRVFAINTIGPAMLMKYFLPLLNKKTRSVFAVLSARVGSISDNRLGGWYSYRASKAALNMLVKTAAIETRRLDRHAIVVGLHPGTVNSNLSRPFQARVARVKLFSPAYSVERLAEVLDNLDPADSGGCFAWDGQRVPA